MLASILSGEFLSHIPCWLQFYLGSFSYTSCSALSLHLGSFSYKSRAGFDIIWGVSLTHPVLASILSGEFLLHIPCWLQFYLGSFSYTSRAGFFFHVGSFSETSRAGYNFNWGVSLTHPVLASILSGEFLVHIPCWPHLYAGVSLTHPMLASFTPC